MIVSSISCCHYSFYLPSAIKFIVEKTQTQIVSNEKVFFIRNLVYKNNLFYQDNKLPAKLEQIPTEIANDCKAIKKLMLNKL